MAYSILVPTRIQAMSVDALNASGVSGSNLENGNVVRINSISASSGYGEVFYVVQPTTGSLNSLWMVYEPEIVTVTAADGTVYKGINQDPRNFIVNSGSVFSMFLPQAGDIISLSADAFSGAVSTNTHANAGVDRFDLVWATTTGSTGDLAFKLLATDYLSIGSGSAIGDARVPLYRLLCLSN